MEKVPCVKMPGRKLLPLADGCVGPWMVAEENLLGVKYDAGNRKIYAWREIFTILIINVTLLYYGLYQEVSLSI